MAGKKNPELFDRNRRIMELANEGHSFQQIADVIGLSKARIGQIIQDSYGDISDDASRDWMRATLEGWLAKVQELAQGPGKRVVSPSGKPVYELLPDGTLDFSRPVYDEYARLEAIDRGVKVAERLARFYAWDKKSADRDESEEFAQAMQWVQAQASELRALRAKVRDFELETGGDGVQEAEVVHEEE